MLLSLLAASLQLASASPVSPRQWSNPYPPRTTAKFFTLIANITDVDLAAARFPDVAPPASGWALTSVHVGAGLNAAVLSATHAPAGAGGLFQNGTARDISARATSIYLPPIQNSNGDFTPWGVQFSNANGGNGNGAGGSGDVTMNFGTATIGAGVEGGLRNPYAEAFGPAGYYPDGGKFVVCYQAAPFYGRPQYRVMYLGEVPENCVAVRLLAQCAQEPEGGLKGAKELNLVNEGVGCYEDVSGIEWGLY
ncbi:hypothetical protein QBC43DRAFT_205121 [Cladorrhinum sp. PSN259]|nr:hypothetical protein QBC43DRAFT_205121 [Cladorrhinum sp. PSN259]